MVYFVVYNSVNVILGFLKKRIPGTIVILTYHSVKSSKRHKFEKQMDYLVKKGRPAFADFNGVLNNRQHYIAVTFDDGFQSILINALPVMYARKIPATIFVTTGFLGKTPGWLHDSNHKDADELILTREQLKQLPADKVAIGSHCVTHPNLITIDEKNAIQEISQSKRTLEEILNKSIYLLSFPHGAYNEKIVEMSKEVKYKRVFSNIPSFLFSNNMEYVQGRISVSPDDWMIEYRLKLIGAYRWLPYAVKIKRNILNRHRSQ